MKKGRNRTAALDIVRQQILNNLTQRNDTTMEITTINLINEIQRLSTLSNVEYELIRDETAKSFNIRSSKLDEFVAQEKSKSIEEKVEVALFPKIEPWPEAISLTDLIQEIEKLLNNYVSFTSEHETKAIALWVIHTYCMDAAYITPILFITSAEMRSGKSTLLAILQKIAFKCIAASSISPSAIFRIIPKHHPTLICDEADTYLTDKNEDLRGIFNAGHSRDTSGVLRTNPDSLEVERFDAFGAKCIAAIKHIPGTVEDRSIIIQMRRMMKGKKKHKMRLINTELRKELHDIQRKCLRFSEDNIEKLKLSNPALPEVLNDRAADNWHALFQIASLAGINTLEGAKRAALHLSGHGQENKSLGIELLEDILNLFDGVFKHDDTVTTLELIGALCSDDEAPWATFNSKRQDQKISPRQLAGLLNHYSIKSINNIGPDKRKGYAKASFTDAFSRYIQTDEPNFTATAATTAPPNNERASGNNLENYPSATPCFSRSSSKPTQEITQIADSSGSERDNPKHLSTTKALSSLARADIADKTDNIDSQDFIDV